MSAPGSALSASSLPTVAQGRPSAAGPRIVLATLAVGLAACVAVWLTIGAAVPALTMAAGIGLLVLALSLTARRGAAVAAPVAATDWTVARAMVATEDAAVAVTDRWGHLLCANDSYERWFDGFVKPLALVFADDGADRLADTARAAMRDGTAGPLALATEDQGLTARVTRAGQADDYLIYRFVRVARVDAMGEAARFLSGPGARMLGQAGVMAVLVGRDGVIRAATPSFTLRALGRADATILGADFTDYLRIGDRGMIFFESEREHATPLRLIQMPIDPADEEHGPVVIALIDEDGGAIERGAALSYIETLLSMLPFGLAMVDRDGRFLFMNRGFARMAGASPARPPAYPGDLVVTEDKAALGDAIRRYATGQQLSGDLGVRLKAQPDDIVVMTIAGVRGLGDAAVLLSFKDTSEETRLKRQVAQATKMQAVGQLAGGVAHDFNNILTAIIGYCDLMLMRHSPGSSDYDDIQHIRSNSNRAANLTRQLLAFSRQQTLRPQVLQLADVVSDVTSLLARLMDEKVKIVVRHGRGMGSVRADPGQLEQVIVNLAVNARDAMLARDADEGGELLIETFAVAAREVGELDRGIMPAADYSVLRISDTGEGIAPDILSKIFEPFFTTKEVGKGTGLGLSTVYGIIKQSNGYIFADSELGRGTSFTIYLPVHSRPAPSVSRPAEPVVPATAEWGSGTILLVEDETMVRAVAERALTRAGYQVVTAADGEEALERLGTLDAVDLVISDVVMPRMDGPTLGTRIRARWPSLPILFMSGYAEEQLRKSITLANVGFLPKPFSVAQLTEAAALALRADPPDPGK